MSPKIKKILKYVFVVCAICVICAGSAVYVYSASSKSKKDPITETLLNNKAVKFSMLLYGNEKILPGELDVFLVTYEKDGNLLKILSANTDIVVFRKTTKALSFKQSFNETSKKDLARAIKNLYADLFEMTGNTFTPDFYINMSYDDFLAFCGENEDLKKLVPKRNFVSRDAKLLNEIEIAEIFLNLIAKNPKPFIAEKNKKYELINTDLSKTAYKNLLLYNKKHKPRILFCDLPAKYTKRRAEPDKQNISDFLKNVYNRETNTEFSDKVIITEVRNASGKPRMAEKAAWVLRDSKFDVREWGNSSLRYDKTLIKDYKGNFAEALKAKEALRCGKILISYNGQNYYNMSVFIGKDCEIYDKLDKPQGGQ
ncbi:MAG: LytR C-terminal domain-containing protein [Endomicrobia bacterium]|nr:LytR C-terminal domain-containing protein [Endomicrobiia bacterium]MCL2506189.1 LytR C-terminal domain-containing protein [Endomicrobiia bacterium]